MKCEVEEDLKIAKVNNLSIEKCIDLKLLYLEAQIEYLKNKKNNIIYDNSSKQESDESIPF